MDINPIYLYVAYVIFSGFLYMYKKPIFSVLFNPFGFSTKIFNQKLANLGTKYQRTLKPIGVFSLELFSWMSVVFTFSGITLLLLFIVKDFVPLDLSFIYSTRAIIEPYIVLDFDSAIFWAVVVISIILHEVMHGIMAGANNVGVQNVGVFAIPTIVYGAYVSIDLNSIFKPNSQTEEENSSESSETKADITPDQLQLDEIKDETISQDDFEGFTGFKFKNPEHRSSYGSIVGAGLWINLILVIIGVLITDEITSIWIDYMIGANLVLIAFNLSPILFTDGYKLFRIKIYDIFPKRFADLLSNIFGRYLLYFLIFFIL